ncbi:uncharacterized protein LACBIDRAFT_306873 [Laccaria bicolor S238N-H82]|uniref:Predicted protein n=1 Tax=Laccaria bicolor (strain S238N-H82 / ATCC MYA-4686) TaxID=486041 RepID=B0DNX1_LACBS|nr:uncharacterized protein LACBIDRAFT_306873 [Laccaria bicolor S238N-H82]EDR03798.1 predicted protein [Laccaria bicolor S238N-H82]|eukprot:XP_001885651.1 predicted protein [Laccaria bicolor S238N-H82]
MDSKSPPATPTASTLDVKPHHRVRKPKHKPGNKNPNTKPAGGKANLEESNNSSEVPSLEVPTDDNPEGEDAKSADDGPTNMICFVDPDEQPGLLVTSGLNAAIGECRAKVEQISKDCRSRNRKFRDIEFDLENDARRCRYGVATSGNEGSHADVLRVTQIFENPHFFSAEGVASSNDIAQGALRDCWFLSALAMASTTPGLIEKVCVARDEQVGVYGFVFFKNDRWIDVVIDDQLFTQIPKFEELSHHAKLLYHYDKSKYNRMARKGGKTLHFARSGMTGETWVALIEKAYAKLHGNYKHLDSGFEGEALEELTGGVATYLLIKDILDPDRFWVDELSRANKDRLFGCSVGAIDNSQNGRNDDVAVQGLITNHAYSVLRAVECKGKRFVVIRNPWGKIEWTGPWSDGSKEWTKEWLEVLPELGHSFGDDGQFVMEYKDFLETWADIDRTILFDSTWVMTSYWLNVPIAPAGRAWTYGDVTFPLWLPEPSATVIVLSQLNPRSFQGLTPSTKWSLDFALVRLGEDKPIAHSNHARFYANSVNLEINLEKGNYVVYVRIARQEDMSISDACAGPLFEVGCTHPNCSCADSPLKSHSLSRILSDKVNSLSIARNLNPSDFAAFVPTDLDSLIQRDLQEYYAYLESQSKAQARSNSDIKKKIAKVLNRNKKQPQPEPEGVHRENPSQADEWDDDDFDYELMTLMTDQPEDEVVVGLKVYTHKGCPAVVFGRLRSDFYDS